MVIFVDIGNFWHTKVVKKNLKLSSIYENKRSHYQIPENDIVLISQLAREIYNCYCNTEVSNFTNY